MTSVHILHTGAFVRTALLRFGVQPNDIGRGLAAGALWGLGTSGALLAWQFAQCGFICPQQALTMSGLSLFLGTIAIGPLVAFGNRRRAN